MDKTERGRIQGLPNFLDTPYYHRAVAAGPAGPAAAGPMLRHIYNKTAELSQRRPRDAPNIWVTEKF